MRKPKQRPKKKLVLGLTGGFGSGKTTVARIFRSYGARIIDADKVAHQIIRPKGKVYKKIIKIFGNRILKRNKTIDRPELGQIVFRNRKLLLEINRIMHPEAIRIIKNKIKTSAEQVIILDAPLLLEAGLKKMVDKLIVVTASKENQIKRLLKKGRLNRSDIIQRIKMQMPLEKKVRLADFVIDNNGAKEGTRKQVGIIRRMLWKNQI